jgi:hypothetical protein
MDVNQVTTYYKAKTMFTQYIQLSCYEKSSTVKESSNRCYIDVHGATVLWVLR